jgi:hypothetical protein
MKLTNLQILLMSRVDFNMEIQFSKHNSGSSSNTTRNKIFISYAREDLDWLQRLVEHLRPLLETTSVELWSDQLLPHDTQWLPEILEALNATRVAVLLVTQDFIISEFIHTREIPSFHAAVEDGGITILWVYVNYCSYEEEVALYGQPLNSTSVPLAALKTAEQEAELSRICQYIVRSSSISRAGSPEKII